MTPTQQRADRAQLLQQQGCTLWFTGYSAAGKSTLANAAAEALTERGNLCYVLDGDIIRNGLNNDLGFSEADRHENLRRIAEVARLFADAGLIVLVSFISPYISDRQRARDLHQAAQIPFYEIFIDASLDVCKDRDPKGLYKKALAGEIKEFTGINAPYEAPQHPDLTIDTMTANAHVCTLMLLKHLVDNGVIRDLID